MTMNIIDFLNYLDESKIWHHVSIVNHIDTVIVFPDVKNMDRFLTDGIDDNRIDMMFIITGFGEPINGESWLFVTKVNNGHVKIGKYMKVEQVLDECLKIKDGS